MYKLLHYKTIEIIDFPLKIKYTDNPFTEYIEFVNGISARNKDILAYRDEKIGKKYNLFDYPQRVNLPNGIDGRKIFYRVSQRYYSPDNTKRILISGNEESDVITAIFQIAINPTSEQNTTM